MTGKTFRVIVLELISSSNLASRIHIQDPAMIANIWPGPLIDYGYRSLTLRTRGVHLHLRVVATRRYSKS